MKQAVFAGIAFGIPMGALVWFFTDSVSMGVQLGVFAAIGFGVAMRSFLHQATNTTRFDLGGQPASFDDGEAVLHMGPANHFKGLEAVGGKLFLTATRLRFRSHSANVQNHDESYPLAEIASVEPVRTLGIVPNGLKVHFRDGRSERFVVGGRAEWVSRLDSSLSR